MQSKWVRPWILVPVLPLPFLIFLLLTLLQVNVLQVTSLQAAESEKLYVQSVKADLKEQPQLNAPSMQSLKRGDALIVLKKEGLWFQVKTSQGNSSKTGWISKLFVNSNPPVGEAELAAELSKDQGLAKASRRRTASYSISASTRGLSGNARVRSDREKYPANYEAVDQIDRTAIPDAEVQKFQEEGKLNH